MRVIWSRPARDDLFTIADRYHGLDPNIAETILDRIEAAAQPLLDHPAIGSLTDDPEIRKWRVRRTPFLLFYAVDDHDIEVRRVRHERENWLADL